MFTIFKNNRKSSKTLFLSYETARQHLRKRLRKLMKTRVHGQPGTANTWGPTFSYTSLGYNIRKVA